MNQKDRQVMSHVYDVVNRISGMYPNNPADTKLKFSCLDRINKSTGHLVHALSHLNYQEHADAIESANLAFKALD